MNILLKKMQTSKLEEKKKYVKFLYLSKKQFVVRKDKDVNEHERLSNTTLKTQMKVKKQFVVRKHVHLHPYPFLLQTVPLLSFVF
jgi:predicted metalloenzyme YecM